MKRNLIWLMLAGVIATIFGSCKKDKTLDHTKVSPVEALYAPANNKYINLDPGAATVVFEWQQAHAEDDGYIAYEVAFATEDGDFSKPLYTVTSDQNGLKNTLTITYGDLNKIANMAGIQPQQTGKLKWTVFASKGVNVQMPTVSNIIEVERPAGFTEIPADLYLTGEATEGGTDLSKAVHFKQTAPGVFEVYTKLKDGAYTFAERNTGTPATYSVSNGTKLIEGGSATNSGEKVCRIRLNFTTTTAEITEITNVELWFAPDGKTLFSLPYTANGIWLAQDKPIVFKQESWGRDERYKFRFTTKNAAGETGTEFFGSKNSDNNRPDASSPASYFDVVAVNNSQYDYCFKFASEDDNANVDVKVDFGASTYTHSVTKK